VRNESTDASARLVQFSEDMNDVLTIQGIDEVPAIRPKPDRRGPDRLEFPPCRVCGLEEAVVVLRTFDVLHLRCPDCGDARPIGKPGRHLQEAVNQ
jgi:hypothetical protein